MKQRDHQTHDNRRRVRWLCIAGTALALAGAARAEGVAGWAWAFNRPLRPEEVASSNASWALTIEGNTRLTASNGAPGCITFTNIVFDADLYPVLQLDVARAQGAWDLAAGPHGGTLSNLHAAGSPGHVAVNLAQSLGWSGAQTVDIRIACTQAVELRELRLTPLPGWKTFDSFDSHGWAGEFDARFLGVNPHITNNGGWVQTFSSSYSPAHAVEGETALRASALAVTGSVANFTYFKTVLPEPEDWTAHRFLTFDGYVEEAPLVMPSGGLVLRNPAGEEQHVSLILGWQMFEWENRQMTFPLQGNMPKGYENGKRKWEIYPFDPAILSNVSEIIIGFEYYADPVIETNFIHVDNMRLDSTRMWDRFEGPGYGWHAAETNIRAGIGMNRTHADSAGALCIRWENPTGRVCAATAADGWQEHWGAYTHLGLHVWASQTGTSCRLVVNGSLTTAVAAVTAANAWTPLTWNMPAGVASVTNLEIEVVGAPASGKIYADDLRAGNFPCRVQSLTALALQGGNRLTWSLSDTNALSVRVQADTNGPPASAAAGTTIADLAVGTNLHFAVDDTAASNGATCYYGVFVERTPGEFSPLTADASAKVSRDFLAVDGGRYEAAFSKVNGSLLYLYDKGTGRTVSYGNEALSLWRVVFVHETIPPLEAAWFSPDEETLRFSYTEGPLVLRYNYVNGTQSLDLAVTVDTWSTNQLAFKVALTNRTAEAIRTVGAPRRVLFSIAGINSVALPVQEGVRLRRDYFEHGRYMFEPRPWIFADFIGLDSSDGLLSFYAIQDSAYEAELYWNHAPGEPVFQPSVLGVGASADTPGMAVMDYDMITYIPPGGSWASPTLVLESGGESVRAALGHYKELNGLTDTNRYPTLQQKLEPHGLFGKLANSAMLVVECELSVDWLKAPQGALWSTIEDEWLDVLPPTNILHFTHWQNGTLEANHPDCQPIHVEKYGSSNDLKQMLAAIHATSNWYVMPFCDWLVWNKPADLVYDGGTLQKRPEACAKVRSPDALYLDYHGYMTKPWHTNVFNVNSNMLMYYRDELPMDLMFIDMTCERSWRYTRIDADDDGVDERIVTGYTQGLVDHNRYLKQFLPLYTEGIFDRQMGEISGFCGTLRQKLFLDWLAHMGDEFEDWAIYPLAADVAHRNVGFYQHDLNTPVFPISKFLLTHYTVMGYSYLTDVATWYKENNDRGENWMTICDAYQKAVASKHFGRELNRVVTSSGGDERIITTSYGSGADEITITANFHTNAVFTTNGYGIATEGFLATMPGNRVIAGIFSNSFNGAPLAPGDHFLIVERASASEIVVRQPHGPDTPVRIPRPADWTNNIFAICLLKDGSQVLAAGRLSLSGVAMDLNCTRYADDGSEVAAYKLLNATAADLPLLFLASPVIETESATQVWVIARATEPVRLVVHYGIEGGATFAVTNNTFSLSHAQPVTLPAAGTGYWFRVELVNGEDDSILSSASTYPAGGVRWQENFDAPMLHIPFDLSGVAEKDIVYNSGDGANQPFGGRPDDSFCFVEHGWFDGSTSATGLPSDRLVASTDPAIDWYHLLPYDGPNAIELASTNSAPDESFLIQAPVTCRYEKVGILAAACHGDASFTIKFHYDDGTSTTNTWDADDWTGSTLNRGTVGVVRSNLYRVAAATGAIQPGSEFLLYEFILDTNRGLDAAKNLAAITLANMPHRFPRTNDSYAAVLAVNGFEKISRWRDRSIETGGWFLASLTTADGQGVVAVDPAAYKGGHYGKVLSEIMVADLSQFPILEIAISAVDISGSNEYYQVALQDQDAPPYPKVILYRDNDPRPGTLILNIPELTGWSGTRKFAVEFGMTNNEMRTQRLYVDSVKLRKDADTAWADDFAPPRPYWLHRGNVPGLQAWLVDNSNGTASVIQDGAAGWGGIYSERLVLDVNKYPWLTADVTAIKDPAAGANFKINVSDELSPSFTTAIEQQTQPFLGSGRLPVFNSNALQEFRISPIIGGFGQTAVVDRIQVAKRAPDQTQLFWDGGEVRMKLPQGESLWLPLTATDYRGWTVGYEALGLPAGALYNGILTWSPGPADVGTHRITLFAHNGQVERTNRLTVTITDDQVQLEAPAWAAPLVVTNTGTVAVMGTYTETGTDVVVQVSVNGDSYGTEGVTAANGVFRWTGSVAGSPMTLDARMRQSQTLIRSSSERCDVFSTLFGPRFQQASSFLTRDATSAWLLVRACTQVTATARYGFREAAGNALGTANRSLTHALLASSLSPTQGYLFEVLITNSAGTSMSSGVLCYPPGGVLWREDFGDALAGWTTALGMQLMTAGGLGRFSYASDFWAKAESPVITADVDQFPILEIRMPGLDLWSGTYEIGLQAQGPDAPYVKLLGSTNWGTMVFNVPKLTGWRGPRSFTVQFSILSGGTAAARWLDVDDVKLRTESDVVWADDMQPPRDAWRREEYYAALTNCGDGTAGLRQRPEPGSPGWGQVRSETLVLDFNDYPWLNIKGASISSGGRFMLNKYDMPGGGTVGLYDTWTAPFDQTVGLKKTVATNTLDQFKVVLAIEGAARTCVLDRVAIRKLVPGRGLFWDSPTLAFDLGGHADVEVPFTGTDVEGGAVQYEALSLPAGATYDGVLRWHTPPRPGTTSAVLVAYTAGMAVTNTITFSIGPTLFSSDGTFATNANEYSVGWESISGETYRIEYNADLLTTNWLPLGSDVTATGNCFAVTDSTIGTNMQRHYRVIQVW